MARSVKPVEAKKLPQRKVEKPRRAALELGLAFIPVGHRYIYAVAVLILALRVSPTEAIIGQLMKMIP